MATSKVDNITEVVTSGNTWIGWLNMVVMDLVFKIANLISYRPKGVVNRWLETAILPKVHWPASYRAGKHSITTEDVEIDSQNKVVLRIFKPKESDPDKKLPIVIYFHGGGFVSFRAFDTTFDPYCRKISDWCNAVVLSVDYRRAPESPYPIPYDDCYKAIEWLGSPGSKIHLPAGADVSQVFLMGDSAGGNIAHFVGCRAIENAVSPVQLRGLVLLQPFFGGEELTKAEKEKHYILTLGFCHFAWKAFLPGKNRDDPYCNVFGPNALDISGLALPPIWVAIGSKDVLRDRQRVYAEKLKELGKDVVVKYFEGCAHAFYVTGTASQSDVCMNYVRDFVRSHTLGVDSKADNV